MRKLIWQDAIDISTPPMPDNQRASYIEGYPLLQADLEPDYTLLSAAIGSTFEALLRRASRPDSQFDAESSQAMRVLTSSTSKPAMPTVSVNDTLATFDPLMQAHYLFPPPTGRIAPSFENGSGPLFEDLAPYIRSIVAFDLRLEKYRLQLTGLLSQGSTGKRVRKTRASRAALEGGSKSFTRKERWFPEDTNMSRVLATGNPAWQDLLVRRGYFPVGPMEEAKDSDDSRNSEGLRDVSI